MPDNQDFTNPPNSYCSMSQPVQNLSKFSFRIKSFSALSVDRRLLLSVRRLVGHDAEDSLAGHGAGWPSNKTPAPATCWSSHSSWEYWRIPICVFLWSIKCQHSMWQQRLLHQSADMISGRAGNLTGGCSWRHSTLPAAGYINRQALHRQIFTADTNC